MEKIYQLRTYFQKDIVSLGGMGQLAISQNFFIKKNEY